MLSSSASGLETLQRSPASSRNRGTLESGHLKTGVLAIVVNVVMVMHSVVRAQRSRNLRMPSSF